MLDSPNAQSALPALSKGRNLAPAWPAILSALMAIAVYAVTLRGSLVYDDLMLLSDPRYSHPSLWYLFWTKQYIPHALDNLYRPLTCMTLAIQFWIHGWTLWPYHLVNILLHAGASAAVAELGRRLFGTRAAWIAGVLFAVHPIHVEVIAGVILRHESLCAIGLAGGAAIFLRPLTWKRIVAIIGFFLLSLLTKEQGVLFPIMLAALIPFRTQRIKTIRSTSDNPLEDQKRLELLMALLFLLLAAYLIYRESILRFWWRRDLMEWRINPLVLSTGADRWLMPFVLLGKYMALMVAPIHLSMDYGSYVIGWKVNYHQPYIYIGIATAIIAIALLVRSIARRQRSLFYLLICFGLTYGMISNFATLIGTNFNERLFYLPSAFLLIIVGHWLAQIPARRIVNSLVIVVTIVLGVRAGAYAALWNHPRRLIEANLRQGPRSVTLWDLACNYDLRHQDYAGVRQTAHRAIAAMPHTPETYRNCIDYDLMMGDLADARKTIALGMKACPHGGIDKYFQQLQNAIESERTTTRPADFPGSPPDRP